MDVEPKPMLSHVLRASQFDETFLDYLYDLTNYIRRLDKSKEGLMHLRSLLPHCRAMLYFTQPSTRTFLSFHSACQILGMAASEIRDASTSSERKGESFADSMRTFSSYVDLIIMRTPEAGACDEIANYLDETPRPVPIINAGSGPDEHPTQALLDIYTLRRSFKVTGGIAGKKILMVGDLRRGRTVRSLSRLLTNFENVSLVFSAPRGFEISEDLRVFLKQQNVSFEETTKFSECLPDADAVYMTRVQDEWDKGSPEAVRFEEKDYQLRFEHLDLMKKKAVIMHPLPRRNELDPRIDSDSRAKYWRQERNGMWTRVALITILLGVNHKVLPPDL